MKMFKTKVMEEKDQLVIFFSGDIDIYSKDQFEERSQQIISKKSDVVLDFKELDYIDSTGLGMLINLYKSLNESNHKLSIRNENQNIRKIFEITDLTELFNMEH